MNTSSITGFCNFTSDFLRNARKEKEAQQIRKEESKLRQYQTENMRLQNEKLREESYRNDSGSYSGMSLQSQIAMANMRAQMLLDELRR